MPLPIDDPPQLLLVEKYHAERSRRETKMHSGSGPIEAE